MHKLAYYTVAVRKGRVGQCATYYTETQVYNRSVNKLEINLHFPVLDDFFYTGNLFLAEYRVFHDILYGSR